jgi:plastocyanin
LRSRFVVTAVGALTLTLPACGGGSANDPPSIPTSPGSGGQAPFTITIATQAGDRSFSPNPALVGGQTVVFRNNHGTVHRIRLSDGTFLTTDIQPNASSQPVQLPAGGAHYHCSIHPEMVGIVNASSGTAPPPCQGPYCEGY